MLASSFYAIEVIGLITNKIVRFSFFKIVDRLFDKSLHLDNC